MRFAQLPAATSRLHAQVAEAIRRRASNDAPFGGIERGQAIADRVGWADAPDLTRAVVDLASEISTLTARLEQLAEAVDGIPQLELAEALAGVAAWCARLDERSNAHDLEHDGHGV